MLWLACLKVNPVEGELLVCLPVCLSVYLSISRISWLTNNNNKKSRNSVAVIIEQLDLMVASIVLVIRQSHVNSEQKI